MSAVKEALSPEVDNKNRCTLTLRSVKSGNQLSVFLQSCDLVSLRAGLNTNLRLASSSLKNIEVIMGKQKKVQGKTE
ncbi:MAG: hypothetical protein JRN67_00870 [Nitrososphaerota archaeon]|nr:hypothetical protein [Nitrososphaerota archaeon]